MASTKSSKNDIHQRIETILSQDFNPQYLVVENESHQHSGPAQDSHFKVTLVSVRFEGQRSVGRHRQVYQALDCLMSQPIHALALHTYTPEEWTLRKGPAPDSPRCKGGHA